MATTIELKGLKIAVPSDWEDRSMPVYRARERLGDFNRNLVMEHRPGARLDPKTALADIKKELVKQGWPNLLIVQERTFEIGGHPAVEIQVQHLAPTEPDSPQQALEILRRQTIIFKGEDVFVITLTDAADQAERHREEFDEIMRSVSIS